MMKARSLLTLFTGVSLLFAGPAAAASKEVFLQFTRADGTFLGGDPDQAADSVWLPCTSFGKDLQSTRLLGVLTSKRTFSLSREMDKASPLLAQALADEEIFPEVVVLYRSTSDSEPTQVVLRHVSVAEYVASLNGERLKESLSLSFVESTLVYQAPVVLPDDRSLLDPAGQDSDLDGLPDAYEKAQGLDPETAADADLDADQDGQTNREEFAGGSDPNKATSRFGIESITLDPAQPGFARIAFTALPGRVYSVMGSPTGEFWTLLDEFAASEEGPERQSIEIPLSGFTQLLRVEARLKAAPSTPEL